MAATAPAGGRGEGRRRHRRLERYRRRAGTQARRPGTPLRARRPRKGSPRARRGRDRCGGRGLRRRRPERRRRAGRPRPGAPRSRSSPRQQRGHPRPDGASSSCPPEQIEQVVRVNYLGGVWCLRAFLPLLEAGAPSVVVNVASVAGTVSGGPSGPYSAAKHAQVAFSRTTAGELAPRGIRVLTVIPGLTHTEGFPQDRFISPSCLAPSRDHARTRRRRDRGRDRRRRDARSPCRGTTASPRCCRGLHPQR